MAINAPKIIGFCGYPGSGKDAAAAFLVARGWQRIAFADPLRAMALAIDPYVNLRVEYGPGPITEGPRHDESDNSISARGPCKVIPMRLSEAIKRSNWTDAKRIPEVRRLLQRIGTEAVREIIGPDTWIEIAERSIGPNKRVVITDVRFANEAEMIRRRGGLICWVKRTAAANQSHNSHVSEQYPFDVDCHIDNDGTLSELENRVLELAGYSL